MRTATLPTLAVLTLFLAACQDAPTPVAPEGTDLEQVTAMGAPAGLGTCLPHALRESQKGRITRGTCLFSAELGRRSAYYTTAPATEGSMLTLTADPDIAVVLGVKEASQDPTLGTVWGSTNVFPGTPRSISLIGGQPEYQVFVSNRNAGETGAFRLEARAEPITYACNRFIVLDAPVRFSQMLDQGRACSVTIQFSPFPEAIGQALLAQYHYAKLVVGNTYEIRAEGTTPAFNPGLTVFVSTPNGYQVAAQSVGPVDADGARTLTVTPTVTTYYALEVSSGLPDGNGGWITPEGSYTLSLVQR